MNRYCNDAGWLRADPALKLAMRARGPSSDPALASQPRLPRWENSLARDLWRLEDGVVDQGPSLLNVGAPC